MAAIVSVIILQASAGVILWCRFVPNEHCTLQNSVMPHSHPIRHYKKNAACPIYFQRDPLWYSATVMVRLSLKTYLAPEVEPSLTFWSLLSTSCSGCQYRVCLHTVGASTSASLCAHTCAQQVEASVRTI